MKNSTSLLLIICFGLGLVTYKQALALKNERAELLKAKAEISTYSKMPPVELQEKCANQAREEFKLYRWDKQDSAEFTSHYNMKLGRCFMEIRNSDSKSSPGQVIVSRTVSDAFEGKVFGTYDWATQKDKKYWEVPPLACNVMLPTGVETLCHSSEEFDQLVSQLMD
jgi:hypothetical protein